ncbi:MAG: hypothetical protein AAF733_02620 [Verrucomicrobiota bacterium]
MSEESDRKEPQAKAPPSAWGRVFWLFIVLTVSGLVVFFSFVWLSKKGIDSTKEAFVEIATAFKPEEVVQTFDEWRALEAKGNDGNILEVATAESTERFTRKTNLAMFGRTLPLGTTVSEISVPATYRYHIDLNDDWFVTTDGPRLLVLAPAIRPSLPVAFDTAKMQKKSKSGWARWDSSANLSELEKSITSRLAERAGDDSSLEKIREASRESVARFVQSWLLSQEAWGAAKFEEISVMFEGEEASLSSMPPVLDHEVGAPESVLSEETAP